MDIKNKKIVAMSRRKKLVGWFVGPVSVCLLVTWLAYTLLYGYIATEPEMLVWLVGALAGLLAAYPRFLLLFVKAACMTSIVVFGMNLAWGTLTMPITLGAVVGFAVFLALPEKWRK